MVAWVPGRTSWSILGSAATYYNAAANSSFVVPQLNVQDLITTFGANWSTRTDLSWGVVGTTGASAVNGKVARTIWATRAETVAGTPSLAWSRAVSLTLQSPSNTIGALYTGSPGSLDQASATANSSFSALVDDTLAGSWTAQEDAVASVSFRYFNPSIRGSMDAIPSTASLYDGINGYAVEDLWEVAPGAAGTPGTLVGAFGLNKNGTLVFSTNPGVFTAVPEPSAALTAFALFAGMLLRRRR